MPDPCQGLGVLGTDAVVAFPAVVRRFSGVDRIISVPSRTRGLDLEDVSLCISLLALKKIHF